MRTKTKKNIWIMTATCYAVGVQIGKKKICFVFCYNK